MGRKKAVISKIENTHSAGQLSYRKHIRKLTDKVYKTVINELEGESWMTMKIVLMEVVQKVNDKLKEMARC